MATGHTACGWPTRTKSNAKHAKFVMWTDLSECAATKYATSAPSLPYRWGFPIKPSLYFHLSLPIFLLEACPLVRSSQISGRNFKVYHRRLLLNRTSFFSVLHLEYSTVIYCVKSRLRPQDLVNKCQAAMSLATPSAASHEYSTFNTLE